ncbi:phospholipase A1 member A-like isoform X2 [Hyalella azteca]|uniref:Phospholipase A1 member A-like isoform X2 n=1 Tax=Hyalella azteca TaxID=294128 RepID=A0A8B7NKC5_HYAAZ|nr:phospholipase A1 member A-like isoform X2 [Hyalella azteca]
MHRTFHVLLAVLASLAAISADTHTVFEASSPLQVDFDAAYLWTRGYMEGTQYELIGANNASVSQSHFLASADTYLIVHGFLSHAIVPWVLTLKDKILARGNSNVIAVQWASGDNFTELAYNETSDTVPGIGAAVSRLLTTLQAVRGLDYTRLHAIGLNLGAHIAGFAAKNSPYPFGRITGLDPASKRYLHTSSKERLDKSDALYVDIMHTNSCNNWNKWYDCFGIYMSIGHTDFWPNGGFFQPVCSKTESHHAGDGSLRCDHTIVTEYFIESFDYDITSTKFLARPAKNYHAYCFDPVIHCGPLPQYMGILADSGSSGDYYLNTTSVAPYAIEDKSCPSRERHAEVAAAAIVAIIITVLILVVAISAFVCIKVKGIFKRKAEGADMTDPLLGDAPQDRVVDGQEEGRSSSILGGVARSFAGIVSRPVDV